MTPTCSPETLYWGLKVVDWLTIIGLVAGPILAVLVSLNREARRHKRQQQIHTLRLLLNSRDMAHDPSFFASVNVIPVDFNGNSGVMQAWRDYIDSIRTLVPEEGKVQQNKNSRLKLTKLIFEMTKSLGYDLSENDIQTEAYRTEGYDNQQADNYRAIKAVPEIAITLNKNYELLSNLYAKPKSEGE